MPLRKYVRVGDSYQKGGGKGGEKGGRGREGGGREEEVHILNSALHAYECTELEVWVHLPPPRISK